MTRAVHLLLKVSPAAPLAAVDLFGVHSDALLLHIDAAR